MPAGFTGSLAARLDAHVARCTSARPPLGDALEPGTALLAPGGTPPAPRRRRASARLTDEAPIGGLRPRADLTIADVAAVWGERTLLVVLTGMGRDGARGRPRRRAPPAGASSAEAESTCTVYGMPRAVVEAGLADVVLPLGELAEAIAAEAGA